MANKEDVIELETRLTYLDDTVEQLNDVISRQQFQIDKLERVLEKLTKEYSDIKDQISPEIVDVPPPHY